MEKYGTAIQRLWAERQAISWNRQHRLDLLLRWSVIRVSNKKDYEKRRRNPPKSKSWKKFTSGGWCWVCRVKATCRHHIIQVQHGGGNDQRNIVGLCDGCHAAVHPWMDASEHPMVKEAQAMDATPF